MKDVSSAYKRFEAFKKLRIRGLTLKEIGDEFKITQQRVQQVLQSPPIKEKEVHINEECICGKEFTYIFVPKIGWKPRKYCDDCTVLINNVGGRDRTREIVRCRDKHTCNKCGKVWIRGGRRFDVHHLNGKCGKYSTGFDEVGTLDGMKTYCHKCHSNLHMRKVRMRQGWQSVSDRRQKEKIEAALLLSKKGFSLKKIARIIEVSYPTTRKLLATHISS